MLYKEILSTSLSGKRMRPTLRSIYGGRKSVLHCGGRIRASRALPRVFSPWDTRASCWCCLQAFTRATCSNVVWISKNEKKKKYIYVKVESHKRKIYHGHFSLARNCVLTHQLNCIFHVFLNNFPILSKIPKCNLHINIYRNTQ